jgi:hypothetical protein
MVIENVTLISPERAAPLLHADVVLRDGRITEIGTRLVPGPHARRIDGTGRFLVPGLIDSHVHVGHSAALDDDAINAHPQLWAAYREQVPRAYLAFGFTSIVDLDLKSGDQAWFEGMADFAVIVTVVAFETTPVLIVKLTVVLPKGMKTDAGTEATLLLLLDRITITPPVGAELAALTVPCVVLPLTGALDFIVKDLSSIWWLKVRREQTAKSRQARARLSIGTLSVKPFLTLMLATDVVTSDYLQLFRDFKRSSRA